ncbi:MAG: imidazole glycerol phosphate synthase subunit HisF, partial [Candidatus Marinimicrobia bacterium]|nr:imidazole glycerol phosphate synthase subunit HisF [Candidatus Neomarinimicrobiota bacterium]
IDAKKNGEIWEVYIKGGSENTGLNALEWAVRVEELGAGEILLTSMDTDGTGDGFDIALLKEINSMVSIPVIASGGAGEMDSFLDVFNMGNADAALAASVFHYNKYSINDLKKFLSKNNIRVRR